MFTPGHFYWTRGTTTSNVEEVYCVGHNHDGTMLLWTYPHRSLRACMITDLSGFTTDFPNRTPTVYPSREAALAARQSTPQPQPAQPRPQPRQPSLRQRYLHPFNNTLLVDF